MELSLADIKVGEKGKVISLGSGESFLPLMNLGLVPGAEFELTQTAPFGDPIALKIGGTKLALRKSQAKSILVSRS